MRQPVVALVGRSGSGKTRFIESLIPELRRRGLAVAYVKHCHKGFELDRKEKDSGRAAKAGANVVVLASHAETARIEKRPTTLSDLVEEVVLRADIILAEGFKSEAVAKVEVVGSGDSPVCDTDPHLVALISDSLGGKSLPVFGTADIGPFADFLEEEILGKEETKTEVKLEVDGSSVDLNDFVESMISSAVFAMIENLRGVEDPRKIKLSIKRSKGGDKD
jgi:molybdopterin-guanine dinucleotide biosynthesis protein MobB